MGKTGDLHGPGAHRDDGVFELEGAGSLRTGHFEAVGAAERARAPQHLHSASTREGGESAGQLGDHGVLMGP